MKKLIYIILIAALAAGIAHASDAGRSRVSYEYPWVMRSVAALGMGNAYYTKSDSKYAPFYNPAGLARIKSWKMDILPITASVNDNIRDFYNDYRDINSDNDSEISDMLVSHLGEHIHSSFSVYPAFTKQNFVLGVFGAGQVNALPNNPVLPSLDIDAVIDGGIVLGLAHSFFDGRLDVGAAARYHHRRSLVESYSFRDIAEDALSDIDADSFKKANGFFADAGVIYNIYKDGINPRVGLAANNIGTNSMGDAKDLPWSVNISAGISPSYGILSTDIIVDVIDVTRNFDEDDDWAKRINAGVELRLWNVLALRGGIHQTYPTFGAGLNLADIIVINYAFYQEEIGAYGGQKEDKRHILEFVLGF